MESIIGQLEAGEEAIARGGAFEPAPRWRGRDLSSVISGPGCAVVVTERRVLWLAGKDQRRLRAVAFALVRSFTEITQAHRYALALEHEPVNRLVGVPEHRFLAREWGSAEAIRSVTTTVLAFDARTSRPRGSRRFGLPDRRE